MNWQDKAAARSDGSLIALTLTVVAVFAGLLSMRSSADGDTTTCKQQDNPLIWECDTVTIGYSFEWGQEDYSIGVLQEHPAQPWSATFVCNGQKSGISYVWVSIRPHMNDESLKLEYTQLFCQAERVNVWGWAVQVFCWGPWPSGHVCRDDLWNGYEIRIEQ